MNTNYGQMQFDMSGPNAMSSPSSSVGLTPDQIKGLLSGLMSQQAQAGMQSGMNASAPQMPGTMGQLSGIMSIGNMYPGGQKPYEAIMPDIRHPYIKSLMNFGG